VAARLWDIRLLKHVYFFLLLKCPRFLIEILKMSRFSLKVLWERYTDYTVMRTFCAFSGWKRESNVGKLYLSGVAQSKYRQQETHSRDDRKISALRKSCALFFSTVFAETKNSLT